MAKREISRANIARGANERTDGNEYGDDRWRISDRGSDTDENLVNRLYRLSGRGAFWRSVPNIAELPETNSGVSRPSQGMRSRL